MGREVVPALILTLVFVCMLGVTFRTQRVEANGTIYIRANGNVEGTDKIDRDGNVYIFTANINDPIVVERDNIVVDGAGYTIHGTGSGKGIDLSRRSNVTVKNMKIRAFGGGIYLYESSNNTISGSIIIANNRKGIDLYSSSNYNSISGNNITTNNYSGISIYLSSDYNIISGNNITTNNNHGIYIYFSSNNTISGNDITANNWNGIHLIGSSNSTISGNNITNNDDGIDLYYSSNYNSISGNTIKANNEYGIRLSDYSNYNSVSGNNVTNNQYGIRLSVHSSNNIICHNNFMDNTKQVYSPGSTNVWDDGYPSAGNYWSDYIGVDSDHDGIGDTPYVIDENNQDNYPLMSPWNPTWSPEIPVEVPFWMQWWFWTIVAVGIVAFAGAVYFLKKRKPPTPIAPSPPTDACALPKKYGDGVRYTAKPKTSTCAGNISKWLHT